MHITIDARMYESSGIGTYLKNIIRLLPAEITLTLLGCPQQLTELKDRAQVIKFIDPVYSIKEQLHYKKIIPECDLFWSPHYNVPLSAVKAKKRVVTIHDVYHLAFLDTLTFKQRVYAKVIMNKAVTASDKIITVSEFSKDEIIKYTNCGPANIKVVYNGVNKGLVANNSNNLKAKYNISGNYILFVGNVKPHKNLRKLLEAYLLLDSNLKNTYKLVIGGKRSGFITGDDEINSFVNQNAGLKNNVIFTDYIDEGDMGGIYSHASLFVFPSIYEGFGLPPLEAMANNCPVIVSSTSCLPEICRNAALYFNPFDEFDICKAITAVITNKDVAAKLVANGNDRIIKFNWLHAANEHLKIFHNLINRV